MKRKTLNSASKLVIALLLLCITNCLSHSKNNDSGISQATARYIETGEYDLRFGVISDTHIGAGSSYPLHRRFEKTLDWYNTMNVKALAIVGDITNHGMQDHWDIFKNSCKNHKGGLQLIAVMGNHEFDCEISFGEDKNNAVRRFEESTGQKANAHYVIDGYHFIVLSAGSGAFIDQGAAGGAIACGRTEILEANNVYNSGNDMIPKSVKDWARTRINAAKADAPGMPIFVFLHWPILNTIYGSNEVDSSASFGNDPFTGFFKDDPEVVFFSGHLHFPNNDPRSIWQGGFTSVNVPSIYNCYIDNGFLGNDAGGINNSVFPKIAGQAAGQGMIISVKGSKVTIENYDFDFSEGPRALSNIVRIPQIWEFDVSRPADFPYTNARRETQKTVPVFDETKPVNAGLGGIIIRNITSAAVEVEFPQAKIPAPNYGNEVVFSYRFDFINRQTGVIARGANQLSDFMLTPRLQKPTYTQLIGGLAANTNYELRIYAYGSFQERSNQYLTVHFTTKN